MAEQEQKSFIIYKTWSKLFLGLDDDEAGKLIKAICAHQEGQQVDLEDKLIRAIFNMIQEKMDEDKEKYQAKVDRITKVNESRRSRNDNVTKSSRNRNEVVGVTVTDTVTDTVTVLPKGNDIETVRTLYNETCLFLPPCQAITKKRAELVSEVLESFTIEDVKKVFEKANKADFLNGKNERGWKASFDWLIDINHFARVLEGAYDNTEKKKPGFNDFEHSNYDWDEINRELGIGS